MATSSFLLPDERTHALTESSSLIWSRFSDRAQDQAVHAEKDDGRKNDARESWPGQVESSPPSSRNSQTRGRNEESRLAYAGQREARMTNAGNQLPTDYGVMTRG